MLLISSVAHRFECNEFRKSNIRCCFLQAGGVEKSKQIFKIRYIQMHEILRTFDYNSCTYFEIEKKKSSINLVKLKTNNTLLEFSRCILWNSSLDFNKYPWFLNRLLILETPLSFLIKFLGTFLLWDINKTYIYGKKRRKKNHETIP